MEAKGNTIPNTQHLSDKRVKHFIETIAMKSDNGMTRIYSLISKPCNNGSVTSNYETEQWQALFKVD